MDTPEQKYIKGFNHGYLIATHEPDLAKKIVANKNDHNEYFKGFVSGKQEHDLEKLKSRVKGIIQNKTPSKGIAKDKGRSK